MCVTKDKMAGLHEQCMLCMQVILVSLDGLTFDCQEVAVCQGAVFKSSTVRDEWEASRSLPFAVSPVAYSSRVDDDTGRSWRTVRGCGVCLWPPASQFLMRESTKSKFTPFTPLLSSAHLLLLATLSYTISLFLCICFFLPQFKLGKDKFKCLVTVAAAVVAGQAPEHPRITKRQTHHSWNVTWGGVFSTASRADVELTPLLTWGGNPVMVGG